MSSTLQPLTGTFTATGVSNSIPVFNRANIMLSFAGAVGSVQLERSFDDGTTWQTVSKDAVPTPASYTGDVNAVITEPESSVLYRWNCTSYTSGTITYRISR